jgi:hypothetical protein
MWRTQQFDKIACLIARMDRPSVARNLRNFRAGFPVDLTAAFIESTDLDRLRHIYLALCLQARQMPDTHYADADADAAVANGVGGEAMEADGAVAEQAT